MDQRTPLAPQPPAPALHEGGSTILHLICTALWVICHFVAGFIQQVAELLAPFLLIAGVVWAAVPTLTGALTRSTAAADPQARDAISNAAAAIPHEIILGGHMLSATSLIYDGIGLMALAAAASTLTALAARNM
ncbi:MAG: hypothetical protein ABF888_01435 [Acetobacter papayae]